MAERTPGDWVVSQSKDSVAAQVDGEVFGVAYCGIDVGGAEAEANACFIAAAPEMLKFIEKLSYIDTEVDETVVLDWIEKEARALYAKARGEA